MAEIETALAGFVLGFSLIAAIGPQACYVLRQGLSGEHVFAVCAICLASDGVLIMSGVVGVAAIAAAAPGLDPALRLAGAAFLTAYGARALAAAWTGPALADEAEGVAPASMARRAAGLAPAVAGCLAITWLNPHVYLDTVVLMGSVAAGYPRPDLFGLGALAASAAFFFGLGYGARTLRPLFSRPEAWRALDAATGALMLAIAAGLISGLA